MELLDFDKKNKKTELFSMRNKKRQKMKCNQTLFENSILKESQNLLRESASIVGHGLKKVIDMKMVPAKVSSDSQLKYKWVYWGYEDKTPYYKKNLKIIDSFSTFEQFHSTYHQIRNSSPGLKDGDIYSVFKEGIEPLVDDPYNEYGGQWMICFPRDDNDRPANMENEWLQMLLTLIGGFFGEDDGGICGADIDIRGNRSRDVISLWTSDWTNSRQIKNIRAKIDERLKLDSSVTVMYQTYH